MQWGGSILSNLTMIEGGTITYQNNSQSGKSISLPTTAGKYYLYFFLSVTGTHGSSPINYTSGIKNRSALFIPFPLNGYDFYMDVFKATASTVACTNPVFTSSAQSYLWQLT